jgi:hypothetical protein
MSSDSKGRPKKLSIQYGFPQKVQKALFLASFIRPTLKRRMVDWDRIPITIVFMSFLSATAAELVNRRLGIRLLRPLVPVVIGSVLWWHYTETIGRGDLRLYGWVQFYPMLAIPLLLWLYYRPAVKTILPILVWIVVWYVIAKVFEAFDFPIYRAIGVSGHTLKHLAAAVTTWYFVMLFRKQYPVTATTVQAT